MTGVSEPRFGEKGGSFHPLPLLHQTPSLSLLTVTSHLDHTESQPEPSPLSPSSASCLKRRRRPTFTSSATCMRPTWTFGDRNTVFREKATGETFPISRPSRKSRARPLLPSPTALKSTSYGLNHACSATAPTRTSGFLTKDLPAETRTNSSPFARSPPTTASDASSPTSLRCSATLAQAPHLLSGCIRSHLSMGRVSLGLEWRNSWRSVRTRPLTGATWSGAWTRYTKRASFTMISIA